MANRKFFTILIAALHDNRNDNFTLLKQILLQHVLKVHVETVVVFGIVNLRDLRRYRTRI